MLRVGRGLYVLGLLSGGMAVIATIVSWNEAFPQDYDLRGMVAAVVFVLALFTNIPFWFLDAARAAQPVTGPWRALLIGSLVVDAGVAFLIPFFATLPGYWLWLLAFAVVVWALLGLDADAGPEWSSTRLGTAVVPALVWAWLCLTLFWLAVTAINYYDYRHRTIRLAPVAAAEPHLTSYVTDSANLLQVGEKEQLKAMLSAVDERTTNQIAVAIYPHAPAGPIDEFTIHEAEASALGRKGVDNGAILFIFLRERVARIEVGYGLEGALPDGLAWQILNTQLAPRFSRGEYAEGVESTLHAMCDAAGAESRNAPPATFLAFAAHLYPLLKIAVLRIARHAWPLVRDSSLQARLGISFFGTLLGFGMWSGIVNAARLMWDILVGFANLIRRRPFRHGMAQWQFMPIFDTFKLLVVFAVIAGIFFVVAGGGSYGGGGALVHWPAGHT
jgi:uncharacterized protein